MEECPKCNRITAETNLYGDVLTCYHRDCGYEGKFVEQDEGILYGGCRVPRDKVKELDQKLDNLKTPSSGSGLQLPVDQQGNKEGSLGHMSKEVLHYFNCTVCYGQFMISGRFLKDPRDIYCALCGTVLNIVGKEGNNV